MKRSSPHFAVLSLAAVAVVIALSFAAHSNLWWGLNLPHFYPGWVRAGFAAAAALLLAAAWWVGGRAEPVGGVQFRKLPPIAAAGLAVISGFAFYTFSAQAGLTGRGTSILINLRQGLPATTDAPLYNAVQPVVTGWLKGVRSTPTLEQAGWLSVLAGVVVFGLAGLWLVNRQRAGRPATAAMACLLLLQPATLVFYGHVDAWALTGAACFGLLVLAQVVIESRGARLRAALGATGLTLAAIAALYAAGVWSLADLRFDLGRAAAIDAANTVWLLSAPAVLVIVALVFSRGGRRALRSPALLPGAAVFFLFLAARLFGRTDLGATRDWSFFSPLGFGLTAMAAAALGAFRPEDSPAGTADGNGIAGTPGPGRSWPAGPVQIGVVSLFFLVPWLGVEADADRAVARHLAIADGKPPFENEVIAGFHAAMGDRFLYLGNNRLAGRAYERAYSHHPDPLLSWRSGLSFLSAGQMEQAGAAFRETTRRNPADWQAWSELGNVLCALNLLDEAEATLRRAIMLNSLAASPRVHLARTLGFKGLGEEARDMLESARPLIQAGDPIRDQFQVLDATLPASTRFPG